jgi:hypothetical protein
MRDTGIGYHVEPDRENQREDHDDADREG